MSWLREFLNKCNPTHVLIAGTVVLVVAIGSCTASNSNREPFINIESQPTPPTTADSTMLTFIGTIGDNKIPLGLTCSEDSVVGVHPQSKMVTCLHIEGDRIEY